jgi:hypothetical protein
MNKPETQSGGSLKPVGSETATYCIEYAGNRPDIRGRTYQEASSETEVQHDWVPGEHGLRIVRITKLPNDKLSGGGENH